MQIVGKPENPKSREPLILLGLWLITQVLLPSGPYVARLAGSSPVTRTNNERVTCVALLLFFVKKK